MQKILLIPLLVLAGCVTIEPAGYSNLDNSLTELKSGESFSVRSFAKLYQTEWSENKIRNVGDQKYSFRSRDDNANKLENNIEEAISENLSSIGLVKGIEDPDYEVVYTINANYRYEGGKKRSFIMFRVHIMENEFGKTVFDRSGRYYTNDRPDKRTITEITRDLFKEPIREFLTKA